jgi:transposase
VLSEPDALVTVLKTLNMPIGRVRLEADPLSQWLYEGLQTAGYRRLMTLPGVGAVVSLTYRAAVDDPTRFAKSKAVGAFFGLTPRRHQSGETDITGGITRIGDATVRSALHDAANVLLSRVTRFSTLKRWAVEVAKRRACGGQK